MEDIRRVQVRLSKPEQQQLDKLLRGGLQPVRTVLRALGLRQLADGQAIRKVARNVGLTPKTVWLTSQRYQQGGLERALYEGARPGKEARLDAQQRQRIVALVCSPPPPGRARWTVRLLAEEAVKRKLVPRVGRETVRILLESHDLRAWRKKCGAWPNSMRNTSRAWRMCWQCMKSRCRYGSRWCVSTKSRWFCMRKSGLRWRCSQDG